MAVDPEGSVHVVYATRGAEAGVFHTVKTYDSHSWTLPNRISDALRENEVAFADARLMVDASGRLHAAWGTANTNGYNQAVFYARHESSALAWEAPVLLADSTINTGFTGFPSLLAYGSDALLFVHVDQGNRGRIERTSVDAGKTWGEPRYILSSMEGVNGFLIPLLDGAGGLHLVINMRPSANQVVGIYYAPRAGLDWSPIVPVAVDPPYGPSAHYTDAAIRLGNEIHVVWTQLGGGEIWHVQGDIADLPPMPAQAMPQAAQPTSTPAPTESVPLEVSGGSYADSPPQTSPKLSVNTSLVATIVPVVLLVAGAVVWQVRKR